MTTELLQRPSTTDTDDDDDGFVHLACQDCEFPITMCGLETDGEWQPYPEDEAEVCPDCRLIHHINPACGFCGSE